MKLRGPISKLLLWIADYGLRISRIGRAILEKAKVSSSSPKAMHGSSVQSAIRNPRSAILLVLGVAAFAIGQQKPGPLSETYREPAGRIIGEAL